jgi:hypothetical protein
MTAANPFPQNTALVAYSNKNMARDTKEIRRAAHNLYVGSRGLQRVASEIDDSSRIPAVSP